MKSLIITFLLLTLLAKSKVYAQTDTIHYYVNLSKIPPNDRMLTIDSTSMYKFFTIRCPCLAHGLSPRFRSNLTKQTTVAMEAFGKTKFVSLAYLTALAKQEDADMFNKNHAVFFTEQLNGKYIRNRVFIEIIREPAIDYEIIKH